MGKWQRTKGHSFEREIAIALRGIFPEARRHLEYQDGEANGVDISNTGKYRIQCKRGKKYSSLSAIEEVQCDRSKGEIPILVTKGDKKEILVALPLPIFIGYLAREHGPQGSEVPREIELPRPQDFDKDMGFKVAVAQGFHGIYVCWEVPKLNFQKGK